MTVSDWHQKEFSRQMRMATSVFGKRQNYKRRNAKKEPNRPAKTVSEGF